MDENKSKKIIIVLVAILLIIIFFILLLTSLFSKSSNTVKETIVNQPTPTGYFSYGDRNKNSNSKFSPQKQKIVDALPYFSNDFNVEYLPNSDQFMIIKKTDQADKKIEEWKKENNLENILNNKNSIVIEDKSTTLNSDTDNSSPTINPLITTPTTVMKDGNKYDMENNPGQLINDLINVILAPPTFPTLTITPITTPTLIPSPSPTNSPKDKTPTPKNQSKINPIPAGNHVYYSQRGNPYGSTITSGSCTISNGGCGPTTVAMMVASLVDKSVTPITIVDYYKSKGYGFSCGTWMDHAKATLQHYGIKTTDDINGGEQKFSELLNNTKVKDYFKDGYTFFAYVNTKCASGPCGHYFWLTGIDSKGNEITNDPYYGQNFDQSRLNPYPTYIKLFGVKKS